MKLCWNDKLAQYNKNYLKELPENKRDLKPEQQELFELWLSVMDYDGNKTKEDLKSVLRTIIDKECITSVEELGEEDKFINIKGKRVHRGTIGSVAIAILGKEYAEIFRAWLKLERECPFENAEHQHSQRSSLIDAHLDNIHNTMLALLKLRALQWTDEKILRGGNTEEEITILKNDYATAEWMAAKISLGHSMVINFAKEEMDNICSPKMLNHAILKAIAISGNHKLLELEGKLLKSCQQDGLKQAICQHMNDGQPESFIYLMDIIMANNLQRLTPIQKVFETMIGFDFLKNEELKSLIELLYHNLKNRSQADKLIYSKEPLEIYIGLWAKGFYDINSLNHIAPLIIGKGKMHQARTFFLYLYKIAINAVNLCQLSATIALPRWKNEPSLMTLLLKVYLPEIQFGYFSRYNPTADHRHYFPSRQTAIDEYYILKEVLSKIPSNQNNQLMICRDEVIEAMCKIVYLLEGEDKIHDDICDFVEELSSEVRTSFFSNTLHHPNTEKQKRTVIQALSDRSSDVRSQAITALNNTELNDANYLDLEDILRMKYADMRVAVIQLIMKLPEDKLTASLTRLINDKVAERRLAALDILLQLSKKKPKQHVAYKLLPFISKRKKPSSKEQVLIDEILRSNSTSSEESTTPTRVNGFGLYDPKQEVSIPAITPDKDFDIRKAFAFMQSGEALRVCEKLNKLIEKNKNSEFADNQKEGFPIDDDIAPNYLTPCLSDITNSKLWNDFYRHEIADPGKLIQICFMIDSELEEEADYDKAINEAKDFSLITDKLYEGIKYKGLSTAIDKMEHSNQIVNIIRMLTRKYVDEATYQYYSVNILLRLLLLLDKQNIYRHYYNKHTYIPNTGKWGEEEEVYPIQSNRYVKCWLEAPTQPIADELFRRYFTVRYQLYQLTDYMNHHPSPKKYNSYIRGIDMIRARQLGLIPEGEVYREILGRSTSFRQIESVSLFLDESNRTYNNIEKYEDMIGYDFSPSIPLINNIINLILDIELKRGDSETEVSKIAFHLHHVLGAEFFVRILKAIGKSSFAREIKSYYPDSTKKDALSQLLYKCYPLSSDSPASLKKLIEKEGISEERLINAAMYAPQWLGIVEKAIQWKGLSSAGYFIHAHIGDHCGKLKLAIATRYTPFSIEDLQEGTFDINWFREIYKTLGNKQFGSVCAAAKHITSSSCLTRMRKYMDAVNGKYGVADIKKEIVASRNQDLLIMYSLIPLDTKSDKDLIERYQYLQLFKNQCSSFTLQVQFNEKKAVNRALQNLAQNAGYENVFRFMWHMEVETLKDILPYFSPIKLEDIDICIQVSDTGKPEIKLIKKGKELNSIPASLKKNPLMEKLKDMYEHLVKEYRHSCNVLEHDMERRSCFSVTELNKLMQHPIIGLLLKNLLFIGKEGLGFYAESQLLHPDGNCTRLTSKSMLRIAHPTDLYANENWQTWQKSIANKAIHQPFEQISRKLYSKKDDEKEMTQFLRDTGKQLSPQKVAKVMKQRYWIPSPENGLQKIYFEENIIASIHAPADWFLINDPNPVTIKYVSFQNRDNLVMMAMSQVPSIIFSEVMRDIDLMSHEEM